MSVLADNSYDVLSSALLQLGYSIPFLQACFMASHFYDKDTLFTTSRTAAGLIPPSRTPYKPKVRSESGYSAGRSSLQAGLLCSSQQSSPAWRSVCWSSYSRSDAHHDHSSTHNTQIIGLMCLAPQRCIYSCDHHVSLPSYINSILDHPGRWTVLSSLLLVDS